MPKRFHIFRWTIALLVIALAAAPVLAQYGQSTGGTQGRVTDEAGGALPGVQVTVRGPGVIAVDSFASGINAPRADEILAGIDSLLVFTAPESVPPVIRILESEFKN